MPGVATTPGVMMEEGGAVTVAAEMEGEVVIEPRLKHCK